MAYNFQNLPDSSYKNSHRDIALRSNVELLEYIESDSNIVHEYEFIFNNETVNFSGGNVDWVSAGKSRHWRKSLHSFEYLHDSGRSFSTKCHLINDWIINSSKDISDSWDSYVVATRICSWIKFILKPDIFSVTHSLWLESLNQQISWLERNPGKQIQMSYPVRTAKALYFGGMYFQGTNANRWLSTSVKLLNEHIQEQILEDGGHIDRSPMYHSIIAHDLLDIISLSLGSNVPENKIALDHFLRIGRRMLDFLFDITMPDGDIPLFNDSAFGVAPKPSLLFSYGKNLFGYRRKNPVNVVRAIEKKNSGYFIIKGKGDMLIVDVGETGHDFKPGQSHCDLLSYELCFDGRRIVVDSGFKDYRLTASRCYARSTEAHNTIMIDDREQSEVWGEFGVGRLAKPISSSISLNGGVTIEASHDGYKNLKKGSLIHKRTYSYKKDTLAIMDSLSGDGKHLVKSFIHLHPDLHVQMENKTLNIKMDNHAVALLTILDDVDLVDISLETGKYFPELGKEQENIVIQLSCICIIPMNIGYSIKKLS